MIPKECKRLAEVDFPIAVVSKHSAREKSIRHGHPSTLHLWWARRPLASCRAMLMALLLPDPCDPLCPGDFKARAREALSAVRRPSKTDEDLRQTLLWFIGSFANWDMASNETYVRVARGLVKAAHPEETPLVVDPFAGGGSIPLEALRLGCEAFASDLNPVACLILKVMLEDIPRHGPELADELRRVGKEIKEAAEKELAEFYPPDPDGATPIAYLWARTVRCESPNCGAEIPLMRSFWLCKKANRKRALRPVVHHRGTENTEKDRKKSPCPLCLRGEFPHVAFEIFEPKRDSDVHAGTVTRAKATCLCCGNVLSPDRVRAQLAEQRGGADVIFDQHGQRTGGARMTAVVTLHPGEQGRHYRLPTERDYEAVFKAQKRLKKILDDWEKGGRQGLCPVPDEPLPPIGTLGFRVQRYGMLQWGDLFTARQNFSLIALAAAVNRLWHSGDKARDSIAEILSCCMGKRADYASSLTKWHLTFQKTTCTFGRQALPITWDFVEPTALGDTSGSYGAGLHAVIAAASTLAGSGHVLGQVQQGDAAKHPLPGESVSVFFTDPPYYDAIPYSDLSDYFLVWMKRALPGHALLRDPFDLTNSLSPKKEEVVQDETKEFNGRPKNQDFFEHRIADSFAEGRRVLRDDGIGSIVFAHKTTEGWEALLSGMTRGGWTITGSWPVATERPGRLRSQDSAALATSVHLVCRPRPENAPVGDWAEVLRELPVRVGDWMERLQGEGVRGADLVFACIGPALEIFSRYRRVETASGEEVKLAAYLEKVWEVVGRAALEQVLGTAEAKARNGMAGAVEEDARLTALFLWTLQSTKAEELNHGDTEDSEEEDEESEDEEGAPKGKAKGFSLVFDVVRRFAQPLGIQLPKWEDRIIKTEKGVVRLLPVSERAKQLFGVDGASAVAERLEKDSARNVQQVLFPEMEASPAPKVRGRRRKVVVDPSAMGSDRMQEATSLDRVHAAMLLQAGGQTNALRALIKAEIDRGPYFLRLANSLSALYPPGSEEKRLLDAMLLAVPR